MENERKYNIGDKVVCIDKSYYDNPYHKDKFIQSSVVSDVHTYSWGRKVFYIHNGKRRVDSIGDTCSYQPDEYSDTTGRHTDYPNHEVWLHAEKDKEEIQRLISEAKSEFAEKCKEAREKLIAKNKGIIASLQREIERLEAGDDYPDVASFNKIRKESEWNNEMDGLISKHL